MVATAKRKAERAKAFAGARAKSQKQKDKNTAKSKPKTASEHSSKLVTTEAEEDEQDENGTDNAPQKDKKHRFIVFIGNLPYSATTEQIKQHFASVSPSSVRHSTDKTTGKSKGFAFLEFEDYSRMETCIKTFHHSLFGAPNEPSSAADTQGKSSGRTKAKDEIGRRINVELTVGGGGSKSSARRSKLKAKNEKLSEERKKRAAATTGGKGKAQDRQENVENDKAEENHIHPSRRAKFTR